MDRRSHPSPLPMPPAGFLLDQHGRVLLAASKRIATIVDASNNLPLECVIRRVFQSSKGDECMLLYPVDTPIQILKSTNFSGWSAVCVIFLSFHLLVFSVNDEEVETIIPAAAYALAKIHVHLVFSGCLWFIICHFKSNVYPSNFYFNDNNDFDSSDDGENIEGLPSEGVEITCFNLDGAYYMIYTPSDPLLFVAVKVHYLLINKNNSDLILQGEMVFSKLLTM
ncbi:hypothetical protein C4D60_Mb06t18960 [Musa balbisiana]|uniref:Uncharacterized protein n=1 Tax=Musa balbisiana TaxID=52838 RepID=A0A4S8IPS2_MUSBA|nr:hypothetical protein C4D60_Mb06t18960 [Musa balbisiana]